MDKLPLEILMKIFRQMNLVDWCCILPNVCRKWKDIMVQLWNDVDAFYYNSQTFDAYRVWTKNGKVYEANGNDFKRGSNKRDDENFYLLLSKIYSSLKFAQLTMDSRIAISSVRSLRIATSLSFLDVQCDVPCLFAILEMVSVEFRQLYSLYVSDYQYHSSVLLSRNFSSNSNKLQQIIAQILLVCVRLREFGIRVYELKLPGIDEFRLLNNLPLNSLTWSNSNFSVSATEAENIFSNVENLSPHLRELDLELDITGSLVSLNGSRCGRIMEKLSTDKRIERLHVSFSCFDRNTAFWSENFISPLENFVNLCDLKLAHLNFNSVTSLKILRKVAIRLTNLELNKIVGSKLFFEDHSLPVLNELTTLTVLQCMDVGSDCMTNFVLSKCPRLTSLTEGMFDGPSLQTLISVLHSKLHKCSPTYIQNSFTKKISITSIKVSEIFANGVNCGVSLRKAKFFLEVTIQRQCHARK